MANSVADELRKAFDHVGLSRPLFYTDTQQDELESGTLEHYSFWVPETYTFREPASGLQWRRIEDENPADGTEVLVWPSSPDKPMRHVTAFYLEQVGYCMVGWGHRKLTQEPTHWMPLPKPPSD